VLLLILGLALTWHALREMAWGEAWELLAGIGPHALLILLALNLAMLPVMTARWWELLKTLDSPVELLSLCAYRCAANAVSYLTPGPHFGGEPLSIYLLYKWQGIPLPSATTSVALDRLLELMASLMVLIIGLCLLNFTPTGTGSLTKGWMLPLALTLSVVFIALLAALFTGQRPLTRFVSQFKRFGSRSHTSNSGTTGLLQKAITQGETVAEYYMQQHLRSFLLANLFSLGHWLGVFAEFWLMAAFMGYPLSIGQLMAVVIAARLAFLTPLPAGLGVLESALPWLTDSFGMGGALGLSLCLIIRFRDLLFSLAGLTLTVKYLTCPGKASIFN
jgi:uncharacterized protein (TIRG00374 family)